VGGTAFAWKLSLLGGLVASAAYVHLRGRVRHSFLRQLTDHSTLLAPLNALVYLFSAVPARPYLDLADFPELRPLAERWREIREEAVSLEAGDRIRAAAGYEDAGFNSFFRRGWRRFCLKWYGEPLPSARERCPRTVALVEAIPSVRAAMFALLPGGERDRERAHHPLLRRGAPAAGIDRAAGQPLDRRSLWLVLA
jgi:beta-hydroxylase